MSALVYQAINAVAAELAWGGGIAKTHHNSEGDYAYRGIEDVLAALAPCLATHKLCVLPRVLQRDAARPPGQAAKQRVVLRVAFDLVSAIDGSSHAIESFGEALDDSDKGTAKAMSAAYKAAMLQAFCVAVPQEDADATSPGVNRSVPTPTTTPEPVEGWESWSAEVFEIAKSCESTEAIERLLGSRRSQLSALQRAAPELYTKVGDAIAKALAEVQRPKGPKGQIPNREPKHAAKTDAHYATPEAA